MVKGVTKRIVEIKSPASGYFERAVLYLRTDSMLKNREAKRLAEEYVAGIEPKEPPERRNMRIAVTALSMSLALALTALAAVLLLYGLKG